MPREGSISRAELDQMFAEWGAAFTKAIVEKILIPPGSENAARAAAHRDEEMRTHDPQFYDAVQAVRKAREHGAFLTEGADVGRRTGVGVRKLSGPTEPDADNARVGPKLREIRRRLRAPRED